MNKKTKKNNKKRNVTIRRKNCSPYGEDVKISNETCLSGEVIHRIKKSYNENNPTRKIRYKNSMKIINALKKNKPTCESEMCWLNEIQDEEKRKEIIDIFYAPKQPKEWKSNPDEWLSNYDILDVLNQYESKYKNFKILGPTPINFDSKDMNNKEKCVWDDLCNFSLNKYIKKKIDKIGVIFNLAKQGEEGTHWVSLFVDLKHKYIFYFDSNGEECPNEIKELIKRIKEQAKGKNIKLKEIYNKVEHQSTNTECGMYSLYFIITLLTEEINDKKIKNIDRLLSHFYKHRIPDYLVFKHRSIYFNE